MAIFSIAFILALFFLVYYILVSTIARTSGELSNLLPTSRNIFAVLSFSQVFFYQTKYIKKYIVK